VKRQRRRDEFFIMSRTVAIAFAAPLLAANAVTGSSVRSGCQSLLKSVEHHDDAELGLICRSRLAADECSSIVASLGQKPWSKAKMDVACEAHEQLLLSKRLLMDDRPAQDLDESMHEKQEALAKAHSAAKAEAEEAKKKGGIRSKAGESCVAI